MSYKSSPLVLLLATLIAAPAIASDNPFAEKSTGKTYLVAAAEAMKCGSDMKADTAAQPGDAAKPDTAKPDTAKAADEKCGDMKDMKAKMKKKHKKMMDMDKCGSGKDAGDKKPADKGAADKKCGSM